MAVKSITIKDYITIPCGDLKLKCPISQINMTNDELKDIMTGTNPPIHIYAINPKNKSQQVRITRKNCTLSNEELFETVEVVGDVEEVKPFYTSTEEDVKVDNVVEEDKKDEIVDAKNDTPEVENVIEIEPETATDENVIVINDEKPSDNVTESQKKEINNSNKNNYKNNYNKNYKNKR